MNGVEHYDHAERLIVKSVKEPASTAALLLAQAQVHATLALADFTAACADRPTS